MKRKILIKKNKIDSKSNKLKNFDVVRDKSFSTKYTKQIIKIKVGFCEFDLKLLGILCEERMSHQV